MGKAKAIIMDTVLDNLKTALDDLDSAINQKQRDFSEEPKAEAENHYKLGILSAAEILVRRAHATLEDYEKWKGKSGADETSEVSAVAKKEEAAAKDVSYLKKGTTFKDEDSDSWELEDIQYITVTQDKPVDKPTDELNYINGELVLITRLMLKRKSNPREKRIYGFEEDGITGSDLVDNMLKDFFIVNEINVAKGNNIQCH